MPDIDEQELDQQDDEKQLAPESQSFSIELQITANGISVSGPLPVPSMPQKENSAELLPDLTAALKAVIKIVRDNPLTEDGNAQLDAGYKS